MCDVEKDPAILDNLTQTLNFNTPADSSTHIFVQSAAASRITKTIALEYECKIITFKKVGESPAIIYEQCEGLEKD